MDRVMKRQMQESGNYPDCSADWCTVYDLGAILICSEMSHKV